MGGNGKKEEPKIDIRFDWKDFLRRAGTDIEYAGLGCSKGYLLHAALLCQRAVEKTLKAILLRRGASFQMSHRLTDIFPQCVAELPELERFRTRCEALDRFRAAEPVAPPARRRAQVAAGPEPDRAEVDAALALARELLEWVNRKLGNE